MREFVYEITTNSKKQNKEVKREIERHRKKLHFSKKELLEYSWKEKIYIIISWDKFIGICILIRRINKHK